MPDFNLRTVAPLPSPETYTPLPPMMVVPTQPQPAPEPKPEPTPVKLWFILRANERGDVIKYTHEFKDYAQAQKAIKDVLAVKNGLMKGDAVEIETIDPITSLVDAPHVITIALAKS